MDKTKIRTLKEIEESIERNMGKQQKPRRHPIKRKAASNGEANLLAGVAKEINQLHLDFCAGIRQSLLKAVRIGELLIQQKAKVAHGEWIPWIEKNLAFNHNMAARYMRCFHNRERLNESSNTHLTIIDLAKMTDTPTAEEIAEQAANKAERTKQARAIAAERREKAKQTKAEQTTENGFEEEAPDPSEEDIAAEEACQEEEEYAMSEREAKMLWNHYERKKPKADRIILVTAMLALFKQMYPGVTLEFIYKEYSDLIKEPTK